MSKILVTQSSLPEFTEYAEEIKSLWKTRQLTNSGEKHAELAQCLKSYLCSKNLTLFTNGHLALEYALQTLNIKGEVITTPFTFASTTQAIVRAGCTPVFCDIKKSDYTINPGKIESLITERTAAILPVHVYGNPCDVEAIGRIAKKHGIKVLYDAAHAFGTTLNGVPLSAFGDISMYSFHATKLFHTVEGGALTYGDSRYASIIDALLNFGQTTAEDVDYIGGNAKMSEFHAAMGLCNLRHIEDYITKRGEICARYRERLGTMACFSFPVPLAGTKSNHAYFPVVAEGSAGSRDAILEKLQKKEIYARKYFFPPTNKFKCYEGKFDLGDTPVSDDISSHVLCLPLSTQMEQGQVDRICDIILSRD